MADSQNQILGTDFTNQLELEVQQATSMFRGKIPEMPVTGDIFEHQNLGAEEADEITTRNQVITLGSPDHERRGALIQGFYKALPIDNDDVLKSLVDIKSGYSRTLAQMMMRRLDKTVAAASVGNVLTGKQFTTTVSASTDGVQTVTAGSGLNYDKLREVQQKLMSKGNMLDGERAYIAMTDVQFSTLMTEVEVISGDYNKAEAAKTGKLPTVLGFEFIVFPSNPKTGESIISKPSTRTCFAFTESALKLGMLSDMEVRYERNPAYVDMHQLVITSRFAALRTQGEKVVQINVTE
mgnify:CR=1 FL=1